MLFAGLGGSGGRLLGVGTSTCRGDCAGVVVAGEKGCLRNMETSRMSLAGVASTTGSSVATLRRLEGGLGLDSIGSCAKRLM